jgi:hypothetical protein
LAAICEEPRPKPHVRLRQPRRRAVAGAVRWACPRYCTQNRRALTRNPQHLGPRIRDGMIGVWDVPILAYPKPAQKPRPPILLGVNTSNALQRVADDCDGWLPIASRTGDLAAGIADLHRRTEKAERDPHDPDRDRYGRGHDSGGYRRAAGSRTGSRPSPSYPRHPFPKFRNSGRTGESVISRS